VRFPTNIARVDIGIHSHGVVAAKMMTMMMMMLVVAMVVVSVVAWCGNDEF